MSEIETARNALKKMGAIWGLSDADTAALLSPNTLERFSYLLGIYKSLHTIYDDAGADRWPTARNTNPLFGGKTPVEYMLSGGTKAIEDVRGYLLAVEQGY
jgi:hypothetical protein